MNLRKTLDVLPEFNPNTRNFWWLTFMAIMAVLNFVTPVPISATGEGTPSQLTNDLALRLAFARGRVVAHTDESETRITQVRFVLPRESSALIRQAKPAVSVYRESEPDRPTRLNLKFEGGEAQVWSAAFEPKHRLVMEVTSPLLREPIHLRLYEPYGSKEPAINDLRFVPD